MKTTRLLMVSLFAMAVLCLVVVPTAFAQEGSNGSSWGQATKFFSQIEPGNQGDHARAGAGDGAGDPPFDADEQAGRAGLGNLKNSFGGDWCGFLDFLDSFDDASVLTCDEQNNP